MTDKIDDIVISILRTSQSDIAVLKENTDKIDLKLKIVESHMTGFMSFAK